MKFLLQGKVDILVLTETKLDNSFPTNHFLIKGYSKPFRLDRNRNRGGLLVYIREDIPCKELKSHSFAENIEGIFIEINLRKCKWLLFATYHPLSQCDKYFFDYLSRSLDIYSALYDKFVFIGIFFLTVNCYFAAPQPTLGHCRGDNLTHLMSITALITVSITAPITAEESEDTLAYFFNCHNASNLVRDKTCFKSLSNPSCTDPFITNKPGCFQILLPLLLDYQIAISLLQLS